MLELLGFDLPGGFRGPGPAARLNPGKCPSPLVGQFDQEGPPVGSRAARDMRAPLKARDALHRRLPRQPPATGNLGRRFRPILEGSQDKPAGRAETLRGGDRVTGLEELTRQREDMVDELRDQLVGTGPG
jgi:hypothetical protein